MKWKAESAARDDNEPERKKVGRVLSLYSPLQEPREAARPPSPEAGGVFRPLTERPPQQPAASRPASRTRTPLRVDPSAVRLPPPIRAPVPGPDGAGEQTGQPPPPSLQQQQQSVSVMVLERPAAETPVEGARSWPKDGAADGSPNHLEQQQQQQQQEERPPRGMPPQPSRASSPGSGNSFNLSASTATTASTSSTDVSALAGSSTGLLGRRPATSEKRCSWMPGLGTSLAVLSMSAGLGNLMRLPRVVFLNGGGAFLVAYAAISLVLGIPLVFLEIGLGQLCQRGTTKLWRAVPLLKGVGYVKILSSVLLAAYYPVFMVLSLFYILWLMRGPLPFSECQFDSGILNGTPCLQLTFLVPVSEDAMWFGVNVALLFLLWAVCMLLMFKCEQSCRASMLLAYVPALCCLVALLVESLVRDPEALGLQLLASPNWGDLLKSQVWYFATIQMFMSTHLGFGNIVTCAGGLYPKSNAFRTAVMYVVLNLVHGLLGVCVVYLWVGRLQREGQAVDDPQLSEVFLLTLAYNVAVFCMSVLGQLWAALAFLALLCAGFASMITVLYTLVVAFPLENSGKFQWWHAMGFICITGFLLGVPCMIPEYLQLVRVLDHYVVGRMVLMSTILELMGFAWIYGCDALYTDFEFVLGQKLTPIWKIVWIVSPIILTGLEVWSLVTLPLDGEVGRESDPTWMYATGWTMYLCSWVVVLAAAARQLHTQVDYNFSQKLKSTLKPCRNWGPEDPTYRHDWVQWRFKNNKTGEKDFTFKRRGTKEYARSIQRAVPEMVGNRYKLAAAKSAPRSTRDKGPFTIQANGNVDHVCWRGSTQSEIDARR